MAVEGGGRSRDPPLSRYGACLDRHVTFRSGGAGGGGRRRGVDLQSCQPSAIAALRRQLRVCACRDGDRRLYMYRACLPARCVDAICTLITLYFMLPVVVGVVVSDSASNLDAECSHGNNRYGKLCILTNPKIVCFKIRPTAHLGTGDLDRGEIARDIMRLWIESFV